MPLLQEVWAHPENSTECIKVEERSKQGEFETGKGKKPKAKVGLVTHYVLGVKEPAQNWIIDPGATHHICNSKVLFVPALAYDLLSVAKVVEVGKTITFGDTQGEFIDGKL